MFISFQRNEARVLQHAVQISGNCLHLKRALTICEIPAKVREHFQKKEVVVLLVLDLPLLQINEFYISNIKINGSRLPGVY